MHVKLQSVLLSIFQNKEYSTLKNNNLLVNILSLRSKFEKILLCFGLMMFNMIFFFQNRLATWLLHSQDCHH